ncbi:glucose 1-dehydrogenase [Danxiaibacter flavus]|uniref:Glucose 1-dehydrogenase n=1 Tax=Danxiaibacter flavus TaxID=3049108 RepID=A0ABV3ZG85_9BACT|nr:glucose 1-dehydrogenase [Chitinophagaceae bacterium DXS]
MEYINQFDLTGKHALVTGGGKGLGFATAKALVENGASVTIVGRNEALLRSACEELGQKSTYKVVDLANLSVIPAFIKEVEEQIGAIDILVNNAGINLKKEAINVTDEEFSEIIKVNQQAVFAVTREVAKFMLQRERGSIVMISSMAAQYGLPKVVAYTASKTAIEGMTRSLAVELSPSGIRVNCIAPGFIATDMSAKALNNDPERKAKVMGRTPMGKLGEPADIGYAVVYLASNAAKYVTGVVLCVDGGNSIGF